MLLFSERTWKHHCVTLLLPFAVVVYYLAACRAPPRLRNALVGVLAAAAALLTSTSTALGYSVGKTAQVYGAYTAANLLLVATLGALLLRRDSPAATSPPPGETAAGRPAG